MGFITEEMAQSEDFSDYQLNPPRDFLRFTTFKKLTGGSDTKLYDPATSKDQLFVDPALIYIHRFLAYSFSGRPDTLAVVTSSELFFLWSMTQGIKVNLGFWLADHLSSAVHRERPLILGSYITNLALNLRVLDPCVFDKYNSRPMLPLDISSLRAMGLITCRPDDTIFLRFTGIQGQRDNDMVSREEFNILQEKVELLTAELSSRRRLQEKVDLLTAELSRLKRLLGPQLTDQ